MKAKNGDAEDEMVRQQHLLSGHEFEQTLGDSGGQGSLVDYSPWGHKRVGHQLATKQQQQVEGTIPVSILWLVKSSVYTPVFIITDIN